MTELQKYQTQMLLLRPKSSWVWIWTCVLVLLIVPDFIVALKDVSVTIPQAVKRGSNALLICNYDMENDTLYSVKWYKGRREFYRYTPKENPAMKVFPVTSGLNVERNLSNQSHVVLLNVPLNISGKFTCEISVEAPTFQTAMVSSEMEVVELPIEQATVTGIQPRYRVGDLVDGNCSIKFSKPAANLTWTINGIVLPPHHIKTYQIEKHDDINLESVLSEIHFMLTTQHFIKGQMRLKCTASIFDIFKEEIESVIEEDRPRIMASGRSFDINGYGYEQHGSGDGIEDHNESYLTYYSESSSAAPTALPLLHRLMRRLLATWKAQVIYLSQSQHKLQLNIVESITSITQWRQQKQQQQKQIISSSSSIIHTNNIVIEQSNTSNISSNNNSNNNGTDIKSSSSILMHFWQQLSLVFVAVMLLQHLCLSLVCKQMLLGSARTLAVVAKEENERPTMGLRKSTSASSKELSCICYNDNAVTIDGQLGATAGTAFERNTNRICRKCFYNCNRNASNNNNCIELIKKYTTALLNVRAKRKEYEDNNIQQHIQHSRHQQEYFRLQYINSNFKENQSDSAVNLKLNGCMNAASVALLQQQQQEQHQLSWPAAIEARVPCNATAKIAASSSSSSTKIVTIAIATKFYSKCNFVKYLSTDQRLLMTTLLQQQPQPELHQQQQQLTTSSASSGTLVSPFCFFTFSFSSLSSSSSCFTENCAFVTC